jgi:hypothetical protein
MSNTVQISKGVHERTSEARCKVLADINAHRVSALDATSLIKRINKGDWNLICQLSQPFQ